jgi:hypothetical protein
MAPEFAKLAASHTSDKSVIAKVNCDEHKDLCARFEVRGYPTVLLLDDGAKKEVYSGSRTEDAMRSWFAKQTGDQAAAAPKAAAPAAAAGSGPVRALTPADFEQFVGGDKAAFVKFYGVWQRAFARAPRPCFFFFFVWFRLLCLLGFYIQHKHLLLTFFFFFFDFFYAFLRDTQPRGAATASA